jgi:hypothetical protein
MRCSHLSSLQIVAVWQLREIADIGLFLTFISGLVAV